MAQKIGAGDLIPGLPDEVSELCLLRLPFPYPALLRSVSSAWNRTLSNPSFFTTKSSLSLTKPYLVVFVRDQIDQKIKFQCLDPVSKNWCPLPQLPIPDVVLMEPASMASSVAKEKGEMYLFRGDSKNYVTVYSVATNSWRIGNDNMKPEGYFFTSAAISGKVFSFREDDDDDDGFVRVQCYDLVLDSLVDMARTTSCGFASSHYDAAVIGKKVMLNCSIYDTELNTWEGMPLGMWKGWTAYAATLGPNLFMLNGTGTRMVKVYDPMTDSWMQVKGSGIPELLKAPYNFAADVEHGKIYVVGRELDVAIATLIEEVETKKWEIEWDVVLGPDALSHVFPCNSHILYA